MSELIKTKGIVLHEMSIKDHDKRIILFSKEFGKMIIFANGAKRAKSPLLAGTQPFVFGEFSVVENRNSYTLRQVIIDESFYELRNDMFTLAYSLYLLEVVNNVIQEMDPNDELLRLLYISLMTLKNGIHSGNIVKTVFQFRCMNMLGFAPDLSGCMECGNIDGVFTLHSRGGLVCDSCFNFKDKPMSNEAIHVLRYIQQAPLKKLFHFKINDELLSEIECKVQTYFSYFVTGKFKSLDILTTF